MEPLRDLKFAFRMIRKAPVASLVVVLTLGFGIGANGIFYASFYGSALRPLPFSDPDRLMAVHQTQPRVDETLRPVAAPDYDEWSRQTSVFSAIGAHTWEDYGLQTDGGTYRVEGAGISASLFPLLGVEPQHWLQSLITIPLPYWFDLGLEWHGLIYMLVITLGAGLATGLLPAISSTQRGRLSARLSSLRSSGEDVPSGRRWRHGLVIIEYAVALVILATGLLLVKSFTLLERNDRGFATDGVLTLQVPLTTAVYEDGTARVDYLERALRRLNNLPGVTRVAATNSLPITEYIGASAVAIAAQGQSFAQDEEPRVIFQWVSGEYFETLRIPRQAGRGFASGEVSEGADLALISASLAAALWPTEDPLGRRLRPVDSHAEAWLDVIGVVGDIEPAEMVPGFGTMPKHRVYLPLAGSPSLASHGKPPEIAALVIAASGEVLPQVRLALAEVDPTVPPFDLMSMERIMQRFFFVQHLWSRVFSAMALFVFLLAAVGVYGVMSLSVSRRQHELGVRMALGAAPGVLFRQVMREGAVLAAIGAGIGLLGALPLARLVGALLFGTQGLDPAVLSSVIAMLVTLGLVASASPARRAAAADPIVALREQ